MQQKFSAAGEQTVEPRVVTAIMKTGDVVRDRLSSDGQRQPQKVDKRDGDENESVFTAGAAQLRADDKLEKPVNQKCQETDRRKNETTL